MTLIDPATGEALSAASRLRGLLPFVAAGAGAYLVVYLLSPGYLLSGYLYRYAPFTVFFHLAVFAAALWLLLDACRREWGRLARTPLFVLSLWPRRAEAAVRLSQSWETTIATLAPFGALAVAVLAFATYWSTLQALYWKLLPADHYAFLAKLREPPFRGATFVTNTYAAPIAIATGTWAYLDPEIGNGDLRLGDDGWTFGQDFGYLWFADRAENPAYRRPDYFVCVVGRELRSAARQLDTISPHLTGCSDFGIVQRALGELPGPARHELVAWDESGRDRWAIVRLDWDLPPYLQLSSDEAAGPLLDLCLDESRADVTARVRYRYAHQEGRPEGSSELVLYALDGPDSDRSAREQVLARGEGVRALPIPRDFVGWIQAGLVPRSATREGIEYRSAPVHVGRDGRSKARCS